VFLALLINRMHPISHNRTEENSQKSDCCNRTKSSPSRRTLRGLDWLNFVLPDVPTGIGPFLAVYLAGYGWNVQNVGVALTVGGIAGILSQAPMGALIDRLSSKRELFTLGIMALAMGALMFAFKPTFWPVISAQILIGFTTSILGPAICAVSLEIVGHSFFGCRQGRNLAFYSTGNAVAAVSMGVLAYYISNRSIFFFVAACAIPTVITQLVLGPDDIYYERAECSSIVAEGSKVGRACEWLNDQQLIIFLVCSAMFQFANAAMLPLLGQMLSKGTEQNPMMFMMACVVTTQIVITLIASWAGRKAGYWGRKPLMIVAFGALLIRGVFYILTDNVNALVALQILDGIAAGIFGVVSVLVIADLTRKSGCFNLTLGAFSTAVGIGASLSQVVAGSIVHHFGFNAGFVFLASVALTAFTILIFCMPETCGQPDPA
jgi:predicted MFS family arabinose efflux permease